MPIEFLFGEKETKTVGDLDEKSRLQDRMYLLGQPPKVQMRYFWKSNKTKIVCRYENRPK